MSVVLQPSAPPPQIQVARSPLTIETWHRVSVFGHTRSGKSVASRHMLWLAALAAERVHHPTYQIFILWTKLEREPLFTPGHFPFTTFKLVKHTDEILAPRARIVCCRLSREERNQHSLEAFFSRIYWRAEKLKRPATVYVDEANAVTDYSPNGGPTSYRAIYTEGAGMELGLWAGCQDPVYLQREMLSQTDHIMAFRIQRPRDRKLISAEMDFPIPAKFPDKHGFMYFTPGEDARYYPSIQVATGIEVRLNGRAA